jgi:alkanesulfonate monooxygenase SsuD/methylene tetrahydromethanopterin reductase-like flavin-dependent oxidoreductase (luciferase family)
MAEEAATADVLSNGRLEFGVGRGTAPVHYTGYNVPQEESRERFEETLEVILKAWTNERFSYRGKYFHAEDLSVVPKPVQKPHPPIRLAANSPDTFTIAGRLGFPIFLAINQSAGKLREYIGVHREALKPGVRQDTALMFSRHASPAKRRREENVKPA